MWQQPARAGSCGRPAEYLNEKNIVLPGTPSLPAVRALRERLQPWLIRTPVMRCRALEMHCPDATEVHAKLEFLQRTGTFKARGAMASIMALTPEEKARGVTAVSAGNHAIATAFAAQALGTTAKVVMLRSASPIRVERCRSFGAEVVLAEDVHSAFERVEQVRAEEGRFFVHPYESPEVVLGTATVGLEICEQIAGFDALVIPVGGGGLCAGVASAVKQLRPDCRVIGVEPEGADTMHRSFASGEPQGIDRVDTIADSLGAPFALPLTYSLCRANVDQLVLLCDQQIQDAMGLLFRDMKIAVEPACAAATAALMGPLRNKLAGKKVVLVMCGSNVDWPTYEGQANLLANEPE